MPRVITITALAALSWLIAVLAVRGAVAFLGGC